MLRRCLGVALLDRWTNAWLMERTKVTDVRESPTTVLQMASTLILGGDKMALTMAKILSSVGERVCLVGASKSGRQLLESMLQEAVEKDIPFQFVDDLRSQQTALEKRLARIQFCQRASEADSNLRAIITTQEMELGHLRTPIATLLTTSKKPNQVSIRLYQPIEQTKMAQVLVSKDTDPAALFAIRALLQTMGIDEITREQADTADRMLHASGKPSLDDVIRAILPSRVPVDFAKTVMH